MRTRGKTAFVFQAYERHPPNSDKVHSDAPVNRFVCGHVYWLAEEEAEGCPWWRHADGYDLKHRVIENDA